MVDRFSTGRRNREKRAALAQASALLNQFRDAIMAVKATSEEPEIITEGLGILFNFLARERQRLEGDGRAASKAEDNLR